MTENETIGERLNQLRTTLSLTQKAFAQSIGTNQGFLNNVIKGRRGIGHNILLNIAKAYKSVSLRWLLTGEGEMFDWKDTGISLHTRKTSPVATKDQAGHTDLSITSVYYHIEEMNVEYRALENDLFG